MNQREKELIAVVLGDAKPSPALKRWLETEEGRRELDAYRRTLSAVERLYGNVPEVEARVYYAALATPVGKLFTAVTDRGLVCVSYESNEAAFVKQLRRLKMTAVRSAEKLAAVHAQLKAYFAGERKTFDVPLDLRLMTAFQRKVLTAAMKVSAGQVVSYAELARRIGKPTASRAVGQALGHNPIPIVVPCHRVVTSGGGLGGYAGGLAVKEKLLKFEGAWA
jgi:methylated-DNA-[protein]-cysteine S-methyltransferase